MWSDYSPYIYQNWQSLEFDKYKNMFIRYNQFIKYNQIDHNLMDDIEDKLMNIKNIMFNTTLNTNLCAAVFTTLYSNYAWIHIPCDYYLTNNVFMCERHLNNSNSVRILHDARYCSRAYIYIDSFCIAVINNTIKYSANVTITIIHYTKILSAWSYGNAYRTSICIYFLGKPNLCYKSMAIIEQDRQAWAKMENRSSDNVLYIQHVQFLSNECDKTGKYFRCNDGTCILSYYKCDFKVDCIDGSDEQSCTDVCNKISCKCGQLYFTCLSSECLPLSFRCDGLGQCKDNSDETSCFIEQVSKVTYRQILTNLSLHLNHTRCPPGWSLCNFNPKPTCYITQHMCIYERFHIDCPGLEHLYYCETFQCPTMFKCPLTYCIAISHVCDQVSDCPSNEDELECKSFSCPGILKCRYDNICVHASQICDGIVQCLKSGDDESLCGITSCPEHCICRGDIFLCSKKLPTLEFLPKLKGLFLVNVKIPEKLNHRNKAFILILSVEFSLIIGRTLDTKYFDGFRRLQILNLQNNNIVLIKRYCFTGLQELKILKINNNLIPVLYSSVFSGLNSVPHLNLTSMSIYKINKEAFAGLFHLKFLNLSSNNIRILSRLTFNYILNLFILDLRQNYISQIDNLALEVFKGIVYFDCEINCCYTGTTCIVNNIDAALGNNCPVIFNGVKFGYTIFIIQLTIFLLNFLHIIYQANTRNHCQATLNRSILTGDSLISLYVMLVAMSSILMKDDFIKTKKWLNSQLCLYIGSLVTIGILMEKVTFLFIAINHLFITKYALKRINFSITETYILVMIALTFALLYETFFTLQNKDNFSTLCLPMTLNNSNNRISKWNTYLIIIIITAIIVIAIGVYITVIKYVIASGKHLGKVERKNIPALFSNIFISLVIEIISVVLVIIIILCSLIQTSYMDTYIIIICLNLISVLHALLPTNQLIISILKSFQHKISKLACKQ